MEPHIKNSRKRPPGDDGPAYRVGMPLGLRRALLLLLYLVGAAVFVVALAPVLKFWAIPVGVVLFLLCLRLPYFRDWQ